MSPPDPGPLTPRPAAPDAVRDATPSDCAAMARIYTQAIESGRATMDTEPAAADAFAELLAGLAPREALLVSDGPRGVAGWGIVKAYSDRPGYAVACETSVYVADEEQGGGHGTALLDAVVARAGELGYRHLVAKIMGVNERSIGFHARRGYELVGRQRNIGRLDGVLHDVVIMQRLLPDAPSRA